MSSTSSENSSGHTTTHPIINNMHNINNNNSETKNNMNMNNANVDNNGNDSHHVINSINALPDTLISNATAPDKTPEPEPLMHETDMQTLD
jgi:hypothetical protein